jgi:hypothetical protein
VGADLETTNHLFFECDFSLECWDFVNTWDLSRSFFQGFVSAKMAFCGPPCWRYLLVRLRIFGWFKIITFSEIYQSPFIDRKWVSRAISCYISIK